MFQIVLSLMVGIFVGWNFHLFYAELNKIEHKPPLPLLQISSTSENSDQTLKRDKNKTISCIPINTITVQEENHTILDESQIKDLSFQQLLEQNNFSDAMAFYMEANEEELKRYQKILEGYFASSIKKFPKRVIEEMLHYIEIEPNSESTQRYLAKHYIQQKSFKEAIDLYQNLHENFDDENDTIELAQLYYDVENYEASESLLKELEEDSIYHSKAERILEEIIKKEKELEQYTHQIPLIKMGSHYSLVLNINNVPVTLLLDTGASYTFVDEEKVPTLNIEKEILLNTAGGEIVAHLAHADSLVVEDIVLSNFKITLGSFKRDHTDGLLGMNFFEQFDFKIDQNKNLLYLSQK